MYVVKVYVWKDEDGWHAEDELRAIQADPDARFIGSGPEAREAAINFVYGAKLCALGEAERPPRQIELLVIEGRDGRA